MRCSHQCLNMRRSYLTTLIQKTLGLVKYIDLYREGSFVNFSRSLVFLVKNVNVFKAKVCHLLSVN